MGKFLHIADPSTVTYEGLPFGEVINESLTPSTEFLGSTQIFKTSSGRYIFKHDYFGSGSNNGDTEIFYTDDIYHNSWTNTTKVDDFYHASVFEQGGDLYMIGVTNSGTHMGIIKSTDDGVTWSAITDILSIPATYNVFSSSVTPVHERDGYIVLCCGVRPTPTNEHRDRSNTLILGDTTDLMDSANWSNLNIVTFDGTAFDATEISLDNTSFTQYPPDFGASKKCGFWEGQMVEKSNGDFRIFYRLDASLNSNKAIYLDVTWNSGTPTSSTISTTFNFIDFPGGNVKFWVSDYDATSSKHWAISTINKLKAWQDNRYQQHIMYSSDDGVTWVVCEQVGGYTFTYDWENEMEDKAVSYSGDLIDGTSLWIASRTNDGTGASTFGEHDTHQATLTKVSNFRSATPETVVDGVMILDENSERLENAGNIYYLLDQSKYYNGAWMLAASIASAPGWSSGIAFDGSSYLRVRHDEKLNPNYSTGISIFVVISNLQATGGNRVMSKASTGTGIGSSEWYFAANTGLGIQDSRGVWSDLTTTNDYILSASYDNVNNYIYPYKNGSNRGAPGSTNDATWNTDHLELGTAYTSGNLYELWLGRRQYAPTPLYFNSTVKAIHILPGYMDSTAMLAYIGALNSTYSIY